MVAARRLAAIMFTDMLGFTASAQAGSEVTATIELREADGTTQLSLTNLCASKEACEAMVKYGAAVGAKRAWDRLAELLARERT